MIPLISGPAVSRPPRWGGAGESGADDLPPLGATGSMLVPCVVGAARGKKHMATALTVIALVDSGTLY